MNALEFWKFISNKLRADIPVVLLVVTAHSGATPGKTGFKMAAAAEGSLAGSIGGGRLEFDLVEEARLLLVQDEGVPILRRISLNAADTKDPGTMICGGEQSVLLYRCRAADLPVLESIIAAMGAGDPGAWSITASGMQWQGSGVTPSLDVTGLAGGLFYHEALTQRDTLYIIGGGHVSLALSQLMSLLEWRIVVFDDRPEVSTMQANHWADVKIITSFTEIARHITPGARSWAVIMTPSHRADEVALRQLIALPLRYLGMMASRHKAAEILDHLRSEGVAEETLKNVCAPVGLAIASHTPAEIAVSIAAQLIQTRNLAVP
jgi:xanthine dehydrogenase accessory factor